MNALIRCCCAVAVILPAALQAQYALIGTYVDHFGQEITLLQDSTFRYAYRFDLITDQSEGTRSLVGDSVVLQYTDAVDTFVMTKHKMLMIGGREHDIVYEERVLIPSPDTHSDLVQSAFIPTGQGTGLRPAFFLRRKNRLCLMDRFGRPMHKMGRDVHGKRVRVHFMKI